MQLHCIVKMVCLIPQNILYYFLFRLFLTSQAELETVFLPHSHSFFFIPQFQLDLIQFN